MSSYGLTRRGIRILAILLLSSVGLLVYLRWHDILHSFSESPLPPLYEATREKERSLPHYKEYERENVKYFLSANYARGSGWGNVMQDFVLMSLLAHNTNRSFVFNDYAWNADGSLYSEYNGKKIPSRIPLSALLGGPVVGGPWPPGDDTPLSVSREFFDVVCPNPTVLPVSDVNTDELRFNEDVPASQIFEKWVEKVNSVEDPCLMLDPNSNPIFEWWFFGNKNRLLSIWTYLGNSPVATHWGWSQLIHDAYKRNRHLFEPENASAYEWLFYSQKTMPITVPGLLAVHVRRGDFKDHCVHLAKWTSDWNSFNSFPELPDKFEQPTDGGWGETTEENLQLYLRRCYPTIEQIVERVRLVRLEAADPLRYLYVMTNGDVAWVEELKTALAQDMNWDHVGSSRDLDLTQEQKHLSQGLDMSVAQRAQVFVGNGWSSLTSNVIMLRMAQGFDAATNRFW